MSCRLLINICCLWLLASADPVFGGAKSQAAFQGFLKAWRALYTDNKKSNTDTYVPELTDDQIPPELRGHDAKVVLSSGGVAGGVVTEGMGYGILIEGIEAAAGNKTALDYGLSLMRSWLGMVYGPTSVQNPLGGGVSDDAESSLQMNVAPYGVSAIKSNASYSGVAAWKFPLSSCGSNGCVGSATDGDEDAVLGMIYLAKALNYPAIFVDFVMRAIISFASADLGFPDLYRVVQNEQVYVPKGGSQWGGLSPDEGTFKGSFQPWCYNPSYFAPGHYRVFRDFARDHWNESFNAYLPRMVSGTNTSLELLLHAFNGAVTGGYNLLYYSSCSSGAVANWVGMKTPCANGDDLSCSGVPWAYTPYVGENKGTCTASGTGWGQYGADACRTPWRIAIDYILYEKESLDVLLYDRAGVKITSEKFNAQVYLNRFVDQYQKYADCDGGNPDGCIEGNAVGTDKLSKAFSSSTQGVTCNNVPITPTAQWMSPFMSYPTFTSFVARSDNMSVAEQKQWMETFASICDFSSGTPTGGNGMCATYYFAAGQEVISSMIIAGDLKPLNHLVMV